MSASVNVKRKVRSTPFATNESAYTSKAAPSDRNHSVMFVADADDDGDSGGCDVVDKRADSADGERSGRGGDGSVSTVSGSGL